MIILVLLDVIYYSDFSWLNNVVKDTRLHY